MANVVTKANIESILPYLPDGAQAVVSAFWKTLPPAKAAADNLSLYVAAALHTIVEIGNNAGATPYVVIAQSNGTACFVKLYPDDSGDVTVGTTSAIVSLGVSGTSGEISCAFVAGNGISSLVNATDMDGLSIAAPATDVGTGAVANDPTVWVIYSTA